MRLRTTWLLWLFLGGLLYGPLLAQPGGHHPGGQDPLEEMSAERLERVKAVRQAFLTERMELNEAEAAAFFPLFWELEAERRQFARLMRRQRPHGPDATLTEAEAHEKLAEIRAERNARHQLEIRYENLFLEVIPARKLIRLEPAERAFRRLLIERVRSRRRGTEGNHEARQRNERDRDGRQ